MNTTPRLSRFALVPILCCLGTAQAWADDGVGGNETTVDRVVTGDAWTVLVAEPVQLPEGASCIATGSADAQNPNNGINRQYRFTLTMDNLNPGVGGPFERTVEFDANTVGVEEVSSTATFRNKPAGLHTIRWLARAIPMAPNMIVTDSSMTFDCSGTLLNPADLLDSVDELGDED